MTLYIYFFSPCDYLLSIVRFNLALQKDKSNEKIGLDVQHEVYDWFHRMQNTIDASHSWYDTSCHSLTEYWECDGNHVLNWKNRGFVTVFDLLQVCQNSIARDFLYLHAFWFFFHEIE